MGEVTLVSRRELAASGSNEYTSFVICCTWLAACTGGKGHRKAAVNWRAKHKIIEDVNELLEELDNITSSITSQASVGLLCPRPGSLLGPTQGRRLVPSKDVLSHWRGLLGVACCWLSKPGPCHCRAQQA